MKDQYQGQTLRPLKVLVVNIISKEEQPFLQVLRIYNNQETGRRFADTWQPNKILKTNGISQLLMEMAGSENENSKGGLLVYFNERKSLVPTPNCKFIKDKSNLINSSNYCRTLFNWTQQVRVGPTSIFAPIDELAHKRNCQL